MLQVFQRHVASVCSKCFICFRHMLQAFWFRCCICFTYMLQEYVRNVSVVSFLCCNKCFYVASYKCLSRCCICFTHMLQVYILNVSSAFRLMLHLSVLCCKCFMFQRYIHRVMGHGPGTGGRGAVSQGPMMGHVYSLNIRRDLTWCGLQKYSLTYDSYNIYFIGIQV